MNIVYTRYEYTRYRGISRLLSRRDHMSGTREIWSAIYANRDTRTQGFRSVDYVDRQSACLVRNLTYLYYVLQI